jgi:predicted GNAT superfamily acetyltransferase
MTPSRPEIEVREMLGHAALGQTEAIQIAVWGADEKVDSRDSLIAYQHEGALIAGGFVDGVLSAMLFGFPTREATVQHSHRLAVLASARGLGLGARLKWFQRHWCLERGITNVRWTYDPLRAVNANLNIARLGATARRYVPDYYGAMVGINAGVSSDRLLAEWDLASARAEAAAAGLPLPPVSGEVREIAIPESFADLVLRDPAQAEVHRLASRPMFLAAFAEGWCITGFDPQRCCYRLTR